MSFRFKEKQDSNIRLILAYSCEILLFHVNNFNIIYIFQNENNLKEIKTLVENKNYELLEKLICNRLLFGTAGLRGRMGAGYACMNDLVIIQTTQVCVLIHSLSFLNNINIL